MKAYGFDNARHVLDDTDCAGCRAQGAPTRLTGGRIKGKAATRRHFARRARRAGKQACEEAL